ncbi:putative zinc-binding metallopeptidase [Polaribacter cellanae]|uniref:Substrate import-associated zinc metallohydrolase lipoprotein n=1 Tax=Polaribacter cellanae TaxID=2818493 RepID=A0A975CPN7_9FLAO|nr:putative zinc-binding metallopeptidase [Polaribacter cellanae]QTE22569.1 hypothetical protein J3359_17520 [Polaribacter cellanae]
MRKKIIFTAVMLLIAVFFIKCKESNTLDVPEQKQEITFDDTPLGKKLKYMYEKYDAIISYKWDRNVFAQNALADPAAEEDVLPYVEMMEEVFFKAIEKVQTKKTDFANKETPLNFYLIGSGINYGEGGNFGEGTVGQAGNIQPNRLTLGGLTEYGNLIRNGSEDKFIEASIDRSAFGFPAEGGLAGFLYHEFTHYIDAKHDIPKGFEKPAFDNYLRGTSAYTRVKYNDARKKGFMLPYGMQNEHEDFATYVQVLVWKDRKTIEDNYVLSNATKEKLKLVYDYYLEKGLDLYKLRDYLHSDELREKLLKIKEKYK